MDIKMETEALQTHREYLRTIIAHSGEHLARLEQDHSRLQNTH